MRIESVKLLNYRQFQDAEVFFPKSTGKDIHVILASNGMGKTNILNAITWCLYEKESHLGDQNNAKEILNSQTIVDCRESGNTLASVKVEVRIISEEEGKWIRFVRQKDYNVTSLGAVQVKGKFVVYDTPKSGDTKILDTEEDTQIYVTKYLPELINEYIFFDGEQLERYFKNMSNIEKGINDLTQASLLEKAIKSYSDYMKNQLSAKFKDSSDSEVSKIQKEKEDLEKTIEGQKLALALTDQQIKDADCHIEELSNKIRGHENYGEKSEELTTIENRINQLTEEKKNKKKDLMLFLQRVYVLLSLYPKMKKYADFIENEEKAGNLPPKIDKDILKASVDAKVCEVCGSHLDSAALSKIYELIHKFEHSTSTATELTKTLGALQGYISQVKDYPRQRNLFLNAYKEVEENIKKLEETGGRIRKYLSDVPDGNSIKDAIKNIEELKHAKDKLLEKKGAEKATLERQTDSLEEVSKRLDRVTSQNEKYKRTRTQIKYCNDCIRILTQTREEILEECRKKMEENTFSVFQRLLWKKDLFDSIKIDKDYSFKLIDKYGEQALGSSSAAERALLALSFTLALQDTSKHDSLLFIDTPVGRVDSDNRINFMNVLLEVAGHKQVILTFTPSEYDANIQDILKDQCSSISTLKTNNNVTYISK